MEMTVIKDGRNLSGKRNSIISLTSKSYKDLEFGILLRAEGLDVLLQFRDGPFEGLKNGNRRVRTFHRFIASIPEEIYRAKEPDKVVDSASDKEQNK